MYFSLSHLVNNCFEIDSINFQQIRLIVKSIDYLDISFLLGKKRDSIFTIEEIFEEPFSHYLFKADGKLDIPYSISSNLLHPRVLSIDSIFTSNGTHIYRIDSFYDFPHSEKPTYTIDKLYFEKNRGIISVEIMDNVNLMRYKSVF